MRLFSISLVIAAALAMTACAGKSNSDSSNQSNAAATSAAEPSGAATTAAAASNEIPSYPGAATQASGSSSNMGQSATRYGHDHRRLV